MDSQLADDRQTDRPDNLTPTVVRGVMWKGASYVVQEGVRITVAILLARLLTPEEYGIASMTLVAAGLLLVFTDPALGGSLIQLEEIDERHRSTVFWLATGLGLVVTVVGIATAPLVARFYDVPELAPMFQVASICFLLIAVTVVPRALLWRSFSYRSLEVRDMASTAVGGAVAVGCAVAGLGAWSLVLNWVAFCVVSAILVFAATRWRPQGLFSREALRDVGGYSVRLTSATIMNWASLNLDKVVVGRSLGARPLGAYALAFNVMFLPLTRIALPLGAVIFPAYARLQGDRAGLERLWLQSRRIAALALVPLFSAIAVLAPDLVPTVFGPEWERATGVLQLLCIAGVAQSLGVLESHVLEATGESRVYLRLTTATTIATWAAILTGLRWGITGVAAGIAITRCAALLPSTLVATRALGFAFVPAVLSTAKALPAALLAAAAGLIARQLLVESTDLPSLGRLIATVGVIAGAYAALVGLWARDEVAAMIAATQNRNSHDGPPEKGKCEDPDLPLSR